MEYRLHKGPLENLEYEPKWARVEYVIHKTYIPDYASKKQPNVIYEVKGRFRTHDEAKKYIWVKKAHPDLVIRFIISNPNSRAYPQTSMTMAKWLEKYGFEWCTEDNIPRHWRK